MLKNKTTLYVLLPLVVIIWGVVIYRVVGAVNNEPAPLPVVKTVSPKEKMTFRKDTFSLLGVKQDPFLGHFYVKPKPKPRKVVTSVKKEVVWPSVEYLGMVSGNGASSKIYILQIMGNQVLLEKGEEEFDIRLLQGKTNKVYLSFKGERREFIKKS